MKVVCVCNTFYQLIMAMQLKNTIKKSDEFTVIVTDCTKNTKNYYDKLSEMKYFEHIYFFRQDSLFENVKKGIIKRSYKVIFRTVKYTLFGKNICGLPKGEKYDELIYFNDHAFTQFLYSYLRRKNRRITCNLYEEGLLCYSYTHRFIDKYVRKTCKLFRTKNIITAPKGFYCYNPSLYSGNLKPIEVPKLDDKSELNGLFNKMFLDGKPLGDYKEKYIYFPSVYDIDFPKPLGELDLAKKIADAVGSENLLVKVHPRDDPKRFISEGLKVDTNSDLPWEVIQMNYDFSNNVFLTVLSGSVINLASMKDNAPQVYVMFPLVDLEQNEMAKGFSIYLTELLKNDNLPKIKIMKNIEEIKERLK